MLKGPIWLSAYFRKQVIRIHSSILADQGLSTGETDWNHQDFKDATENTLLERDSNEEEAMSLEEIDNQNGIFRLQSYS